MQVPWNESVVIRTKEALTHIEARYHSCNECNHNLYEIVSNGVNVIQHQLQTGRVNRDAFVDTLIGRLKTGNDQQRLDYEILKDSYEKLFDCLQTQISQLELIYHTPVGLLSYDTVMSS